MPPINARGAESYAVVITTMWANGNAVLIVEGLRKEVNDMDEYIKREDALDAVLFALVGTGYQSHALDAVRYAPTADVAPRAEVAREIFREIYAEIFKMLPLKVFRLINGDYEEKTFESGKESALHGVLNCIAELEKKYTEEQK